MTPKRYFVVEGENDEWLLRRLLPQNLQQDTKFIAASGYSAALAAMRKLFSMTSLPIVFFFDTNTFSNEDIEENKQFIISYVRNKPILIPLIPEVESLFFYKKDLLEKIVNRSISDELWQKGQTQPKSVLVELMDGYLSKMNLARDIVQELQKNPLLQDIIKQLSVELTNELQTAIAA